MNAVNALRIMEVVGALLAVLFVFAWSRAVRHALGRLCILKKCGFSSDENDRELRCLLSPPVILGIGLLWFNNTPHIAYSDSPSSLFSTLAVILAGLLTLLLTVGTVMSRLFRMENWSDEEVPKSPFTGWACDKNGPHFLDLATSDQLTSFGGMVLFVSGHRTARNLVIGDIKYLGRIVADLTMAATADGKNFQQLAHQLEQEVVVTTRNALTNLLTASGGTIEECILRDAMVHIAGLIHKPERQIRLGLTYSLEPVQRSLYRDGSPR